MSYPNLPPNTLAEIFGHAPADASRDARMLWDTGMCPFTSTTCGKINHNSGLIYGTCSAKTGERTVIICPNRLYANKYNCIREVAKEAFGARPMVMFNEYWEKRDRLANEEIVVALGQNSGREVKLGTSLSMDWVLALVKHRKLVEYVGVEVQSIDITGNYRDNWHYFKHQEYLKGNRPPPSENGYNWANVHKRLIPQLIRKGLVYASSELVNHGLFFVLPEIVFKKFEDIVGQIAVNTAPTKDVMTIHTYDLGDAVPEGQVRKLRRVRTVKFYAKDFANAFIAGASLPGGGELDRSVRTLLNVG